MFSDIAGITFVTFCANVLTVICALPLLNLPFFAKFNLCANFAISVLTLLTELFVYFFSFNFCTFSDAAFKSSWDVRTYQLTSPYYEVGCVQVTLVGTRWRFNFSTKNLMIFVTLHL